MITTITQHNFRGKGQELRASANWSTYSKSVELGFTDPYLFDKNIAIGGDIFRRDYNSFNYNLNGDRNTTYSQVSTGFQLRAGIPLTEYWSLAARYGLSYDQVSLDKATYYNADGTCDKFKAGEYLCEAVGNRWTSSIGYSLIFDSLNSRLHPTAGQKLTVSQDFAGLGGDVKYIRTRAEGAKYFNAGKGFIFSAAAEGGYIHSLEKAQAEGSDPVRITDRFYLGEPDFHGFDIRGVGPRIKRIPYTTDASGAQVLVTDKTQITDDALGGKAYYLAKLEMELPLGSGAHELGLRPSIYIQAGALFDLNRPALTQFPTSVDPITGRVTVLPIQETINYPGTTLAAYTVPTTDALNPGATTTCKVGYSSTPGGACTGTSINTAQTQGAGPYFEQYVGNSARPRITVGAGVNWNSPFGPLRIDLAYALLKDKGDDTKLVTFNVGTQF